MKVEIRHATDLDQLGGRASVSDPILYDKFITDSTATWACLGDDRVGAVWGVISPTLLSDSGYIWATILPWAKAYPIITARAVRSGLRQTLLEYPTLWGLCEEESHWLRWIGAKFRGREGPYISFVIEA